MKVIKIIDYIGIGSEKAVTREQLKTRTGENDRVIRHSIEVARIDNVIVNLQDGKGYFIPDFNDSYGAAQLAYYIAQERSRAESILLSIEKAEQVLDAIRS